MAESQIPTGGNRQNNIAIAQEFLRNLSSGGDAEAAGTIIHPDYVGSVAPFPDDHGPEGYRQLAARTLVRYPDARYIIEDIIATDEDKVAIRATFSGTYRAHDEMDQVFDGEPMEMPTIIILQIADGKVTRSWTSYDLLGPMTRWGVIPDFLGISREKQKLRVVAGGKELPDPVTVFWGDTELTWPLIPSQERMRALLWPIRW
jgi:predicted ester cyclase